MKKRLLITSIVMMLVVAVALSTATYAWFTSNTSVSASIITLKAATSDADALGIGWTGHGAETSIYAPLDATLNPMAPMILTSAKTVGKLTNNTTTYEYDPDWKNVTGTKIVARTEDPLEKEDHIQFFTSTVKQEGGDIKFNNNGTWQDPVLYNSNGQTMADTNAAATVNSFYIVNLSTANTISSVKVSGVFSKVVGDMKYIITTDTVPKLTGADAKTYYYEDGAVMKRIVSTASETNDDAAEYTYISTYGFRSNRTYYECVTQFVLTKDTTVQQDTTYYTESSGTYSVAALTIGNSIAQPNTTIYEKHDESGDNMVRIALFKQEYRYAKDTAGYFSGEDANKATVSEKTYYKYVPAANGASIMTEATVAANTKFSELDYELFCLDDTKHKLLGVLGEEVTTFVKASGSFDRTKVYYTVSFAEDTSVTAANFAEKKVAGIYTKSGDDYVAVAANAEFNNTEGFKYYKVTGSTQDETPTSGEFESYYTARNTVANGEITADGKVNYLDYYTGVTADITFAQNLKPGEQIDIIAVVWLDGTVLDDTRSNQYAQVSLKFDAQ